MLLGGVPGVLPADVVIIGGGVVAPPSRIQVADRPVTIRHGWDTASLNARAVSDVPASALLRSAQRISR